METTDKLWQSILSYKRLSEPQIRIADWLEKEYGLSREQIALAFVRWLYTVDDWDDIDRNSFVQDIPPLEKKDLDKMETLDDSDDVYYAYDLSFQPPARVRLTFEALLPDQMRWLACHSDWLNFHEPLMGNDAADLLFHLVSDPRKQIQTADEIQFAAAMFGLLDRIWHNPDSVLKLMKIDRKALPVPDDQGTQLFDLLIRELLPFQNPFSVRITGRTDIRVPQVQSDLRSLALSSLIGWLSMKEMTEKLFADAGEDNFNDPDFYSAW